MKNILILILYLIVFQVEAQENSIENIFDLSKDNHISISLSLSKSNDKFIYINIKIKNNSRLEYRFFGFEKPGASCYLKIYKNQESIIFVSKFLKIELTTYATFLYNRQVLAPGQSTISTVALSDFVPEFSDNKYNIINYIKKGDLLSLGILLSQNNKTYRFTSNLILIK